MFQRTSGVMGKTLEASAGPQDPLNLVEIFLYVHEEKRGWPVHEGAVVVVCKTTTVLVVDKQS